MIRVARRVGLVAGVLAATLMPAARAATAPPPCPPRVLILSAFPAEMGHLIAAATVTALRDVDGHDVYEGVLAGHRVVMALTGIGPVNAHDTTTAVFAHYQCGSRPGVSDVVFSGVAGAGAGSRIADVTVPRRWTADGGRSWVATDAGLLAVAARVAPAVKLERTALLGDPLCTCVQPFGGIQLPTFPYTPRVLIGGDGSTTDPFGGRAVPCVPDGGDLVGCAPCPVALRTPPDAGHLAAGLVPLLSPAFLAGLVGVGAAGPKGAVANDEETAAVAGVAAAHRVPFIGFRAISDGTADPLGLPGFPSQFVLYKQIAADNAAAAALAFLKALG